MELADLIVARFGGGTATLSAKNSQRPEPVLQRADQGIVDFVRADIDGRFKGDDSRFEFFVGALGVIGDDPVVTVADLSRDGSLIGGGPLLKSV
jgi:hypothetical protein